MPYAGRSLDTYGVIRMALELEGIRVLRLEDIHPGALWTTAVTDAIKKADFIIADLTEVNPNVMYEMGFAQALEKPVFIIISSDAGTYIPSDVVGYPYLLYRDHSDLTRLIRDKIVRYLGDLRRLDVNT
jgi:hypothetical protein